MFDLRNKSILISGGAGILGRRIVRSLLDAGGRVAIVDVNGQALESFTAELAVDGRADGPRSPDRWSTHAIDITDISALREMQQELRAKWGDVDVLINNAAAKSPNFFSPFHEFPLQDWEMVFEANVTAAMQCCQVFGHAMAERGRGSIINTLSIYGIVAPDQRIYEGSEYEGRAINTPAVYSASKAALWGMTKYLAAYWGSRNVRVNAVTPGGVESGQNDTFKSLYSARVPMGRMARAEELPGAFVFLASDAASYVTGQNICVDGGLTVW